MSQPTVGLVGSRKIDQSLQSSNKKTVTDFAFPEPSRTPLQMGCCPEGTPEYNGPKTGDCYANSVEDTNMCALTRHTPRPAIAHASVRTSVCRLCRHAHAACPRPHLRRCLALMRRCAHHRRRLAWFTVFLVTVLGSVYVLPNYL
jgi:hypothetical protein